MEPAESSVIDEAVDVRISENLVMPTAPFSIVSPNGEPQEVVLTKLAEEISPSAEEPLFVTESDHRLQPETGDISPLDSETLSERVSPPVVLASTQEEPVVSVGNPFLAVQPLAVMERKCRIVAVTSGKGGVGKTLIALNMAVDLARSGKRVLLVDADLGFANVNILAGVESRNDLLSVLEEQKDLCSILQEGPAGLKIVPGGSGIFKLSNMSRSHRKYFVDQLASLAQEFDIMFIDTGAGFSQTHLKLVSFSDRVFLISTPEITALADVYAAIKVIHARRASQSIGVIVNMTESLAEANFVFDRLSMVSQSFLNLPLEKIGFVAKDFKKIRESMQKRVPTVLFAPQSRFAKCIHLINDRIFQADPSSVAEEEPPLSWKDTFLGKVVEGLSAFSHKKTAYENQPSS